MPPKTSFTSSLVESPSRNCSLAELSFAMYEASIHCSSIEAVAEKLSLPAEFVNERVEAARLCLVMQRYSREFC